MLPLYCLYINQLYSFFIKTHHHSIDDITGVHDIRDSIVTKGHVSEYDGMNKTFDLLSIWFSMFFGTFQKNVIFSLLLFLSSLSTFQHTAIFRLGYFFEKSIKSLNHFGFEFLPINMISYIFFVLLILKNISLEANCGNKIHFVFTLRSVLINLLMSSLEHITSLNL
ncbi:MAG: hypothetical protein WCL02_04945 [bacterium]